jgi:farnesyl diphosphate synthase
MSWSVRNLLLPTARLLQANYGRHEQQCVDAVKHVYQDLGLPEKFKAYEADSYRQLTSQIDSQTLLPRGVFMSLLNKIYKRSK